MSVDLKALVVRVWGCDDPHAQDLARQVAEAVLDAVESIHADGRDHDPEPECKCDWCIEWRELQTLKHELFGEAKP
jgi:hypothetical protein